MQSSYKLPLAFDPLKLREDLEQSVQVSSEGWAAHFAKIHYDKGWNGLALRSPDGSPFNLESGKTFVDTPILSHCPYFREVLSSFKCSLDKVRLLKLEAGAVIKEHIDYGSGHDQKAVRLHIPIITNPNVEFYSNGKRVVMEPGEVWFIDVSFPHRVANRGEADRIHLVVDCKVNDWIRSMFPSYFSAPSWRRKFAYKVRVMRFTILDFWRALQLKDPVEFQKRKRSLFRRLGPSPLLKKMTKRFDHKFTNSRLTS